MDDMTLIVRAFLFRALDPKQREDLIHFEATRLPPRRYLQGFEIIRMFNLEMEPITDAKKQAMTETIRNFERILWKDRILRYKAENPKLTNEEISETVDSKVDADDLADWQAYAAVHYSEPFGGTFREAPAARQFVA